MGNSTNNNGFIGITVFLDVTVHNLVGRYQHSGGVHCPHPPMFEAADSLKQWSSIKCG
jgi:hypothetical protein